MNKRILGILVCTLLIATSLHAMGMAEDDRNKVIDSEIDEDWTLSSCFMDYGKCVMNLKSKDEISMITVDNYGTVNVFGEGVDQRQSYDCNWGYGVYGSWKLAQSFIPTLDSLTRVELKVFKRGSPTGLMISIRNSLDGEDLTSIYYSADQIPGDGVEVWCNMDFSNISVVSNQTYYIVWAEDGGGPDNLVYWLYGIDDPYERGSAWIYTDSWQPFVPDQPGQEDPDFCFATYGLDEPPSAPDIQGPTSGKKGTEYEYTFVATDPDGDDIYYYIYWGDATHDGWLGPYASGTQIKVKHTWDEKGTYTIKAKAKDIYQASSSWGTLEVSMPRNRLLPFSLFVQFLERVMELFPNAFPILRYLLGV